MKVFKFDLAPNGDMFVFFHGRNLGEAIAAFVSMYPDRIKDIDAISEYKR